MINCCSVFKRTRWTKAEIWLMDGKGVCKHQSQSQWICDDVIKSKLIYSLSNSQKYILRRKQKSLISPDEYGEKSSRDFYWWCSLPLSPALDIIRYMITLRCLNINFTVKRSHDAVDAGRFAELRLLEQKESFRRTSGKTGKVWSLFHQQRKILPSSWTLSYVLPRRTAIKW